MCQYIRCNKSCPVLKKSTWELICCIAKLVLDSSKNVRYRVLLDSLQLFAPAWRCTRNFIYGKPREAPELHRSLPASSARGCVTHWSRRAWVVDWWLIALNVCRPTCAGLHALLCRPPLDWTEAMIVRCRELSPTFPRIISEIPNTCCGWEPFAKWRGTSGYNNVSLWKFQEEDGRQHGHTCNYGEN